MPKTIEDYMTASLDCTRAEYEILENAEFADQVTIDADPGWFIQKDNEAVDQVLIPMLLSHEFSGYSSEIVTNVFREFDSIKFRNITATDSIFKHPGVHIYPNLSDDGTFLLVRAVRKFSTFHQPIRIDFLVSEHTKQLRIRAIRAGHKKMFAIDSSYIRETSITSQHVSNQVTDRDYNKLVYRFNSLEEFVAVKEMQAHREQGRILQEEVAAEKRQNRIKRELLAEFKMESTPEFETLMRGLCNIDNTKLLKKSFREIYPLIKK